MQKYFSDGVKTVQKDLKYSEASQRETDALNDQIYDYLKKEYLKPNYLELR
jgi:hypothetical protein